MALHRVIILIGDEAVRCYKSEQILPSMIIAQAYLESGNGKASELATMHNNYFGLKWYDTMVTRDEAWIEYKTTEERDGKLVDITDRFCHFATPLDGLNCLYRWYSLYTKYHVLKGVTDYRVACQLVRECGYATDSGYTDKLIDIIEREHLIQYDIRALNDIEIGKSPHYIKVYAGSYQVFNNAVTQLNKIRQYVPNAFLADNGQGGWRIQVGAFLEPKNAQNLMAMLGSNNINTFKEG